MLFDSLDDLCRSANSELLLVAPFIKIGVLEPLINHAAKDISLTVVTRWWPQEVAAGVSDLEIWDLFREHPRRRLFLRGDLHAKVYRADSHCLVGSANLTAKALGTSSAPNLEVLIPVLWTSVELQTFASTLWDAVVEVDEELYRSTKALVDLLPQALQPGNSDTVPATDTPTSWRGPWTPHTRQPSDLLIAYEGELESLSSATQAAALSDLVTLNIPSHLDRQTFFAFVRVALLRMPVVVAIDRFVAERERRFGEVRDRLATLIPDSDSDRDWQTLFRWLMYFLPDRYEYRRPRYSELISRRV